jgi:hypothetical protein
MTPLEAMAKAHWEASPASVPPWEKLTPNCQSEDIARMRSALLALAKAELPHRMEDDMGRALYPNERDGMYRDAFRLMIRAIAEEEPNDAR